MKIGIFGGTFDPFTPGHYEIVRKVLSEKLVDKVIVIPTVVDYYRTDVNRLFTNDQRLEIVKHWLDGIENVIVDDYEYKLLRSSPGICVNRRYLHMIENIKKRYFFEEKVKFHTIIGGDSWNKLDTWYEWKQLFDLSEFIVIKRNEDELRELWIEYTDLIWTCKKQVVTIDKKFANVSATKIRNRLARVDEKLAFAICCNEADEYKKFGKLFEEREASYEEIEARLDKIVEVLKDPYKDAICRYSLIEDVMNGKN